MQFEIIVLYDRDSVIRGEKTYILKNHLRDIMISPFALLLVLFWIYKTGSNNVVIFIAFIAALVYFLISMYLFFLKPLHSAKKTEKYGDIERVFKISDDGIESKSFTNEYFFEWNDINKYWFSRDTLVLIAKSKRYSYIPAKGFSNELKSFIVSKIESS